MTKKVICIEGPSGAGKSTLCNQITDTLKYFRVSPLVQEFIPKQHPAPLLNKSSIANGYTLYMAGYVNKCKFIQAQKEPYWLLDRSWISNLTYLLTIRDFYQFDSSAMIQTLADKLINKELLTPDIFIYLDCEPSISGARRIKRGDTAWGDVPINLSLEDKMKFRKYRYHYYTVFFELLNLPKIYHYENSRKTIGALQVILLNLEQTKDKKDKAQIIANQILKM